MTVSEAYGLQGMIIPFEQDEATMTSKILIIFVSLSILEAKLETKENFCEMEVSERELRSKIGTDIPEAKVPQVMMIM